MLSKGEQPFGCLKGATGIVKQWNSHKYPSVLYIVVNTGHHFLEYAKCHLYIQSLCHSHFFSWREALYVTKSQEEEEAEVAAAAAGTFFAPKLN